MRRILFGVLVLLVSTPAWATITRVQSNAKFSGSGTTCAATFTTSPAQNDLIVVWTFWQPTTATASVTDTLSNTFSSAIGPTTQPGTPGGLAQIFYAIQSHTAASDTVTVTYSGSTTACNAVIVEYRGINLSSPLDVTQSGTGNSTSLDTGLKTPNFTNELVFGGGAAAIGTASAGNGFGLIQANAGNITEDNILVSNAQQHATASTSSSGNWVMQMAVFRDAQNVWSGSQSISGPRPSVDVTAFGATGLGVGHDDTAAITAAIAFACANNSTSVFFPPAPNFYSVTQVQTGTSATAAIFPIPCNDLHLVGGNSANESPQFKQGPSVAIVVVVGASPNPGPVFSMIGVTGVTLQNLSIQGFNEAIYMGDANLTPATANIELIDVNTSVNGLTGIGTATQPNCAEVYGGGLFYTARGGSSQATGTKNGNSICILNDTGHQPPGIIQMRDRVIVNCVDAKSIGPQTGTAGDWHFDNVAAEDCNNGYFVIDDDGSHPWAQIFNITIDHSSISDATFPAYFTLNSAVAVHALHLAQTSGIGTAVVFRQLQGSVSWASVEGSPSTSGNLSVDGSGNLVGPLNTENGFGLDLFSNSNQSAETDIQPNNLPNGGFRAFQTGNPVGSSFATVNADPFLGFGMGLTTTYGPEAALKSNAAGSFDVNFPGAFAPTSVAGTPTTGGTLAPDTYYYFILTSTSGNCSTGLSAPSLSTTVVLSGANNAASLTWVDPVPAGTGTIQGYCVIRGAALQMQGPHWSDSASYFGGHFVAGAGTTSYTDTHFPDCCFQNHIPIGTFSGVHRFTARSLGVNTTSPQATLDVNGTIRVGGGSNVNKILTMSATLTFTSISAQTCQEKTMTVTGAATSGVAQASPAASLGSTNLSWSSWVSAVNTVSVRVCNPSSGAITPSAVAWNVEIIQ
ncbi:MAG TPA: hypothetical protein VOA88_23285 [Candidatus Dormibacteraeota bacterium]|nr:hypothetical protein [Candidatus Dormibacteraeota bacterium]